MDLTTRYNKTSDDLRNEINLLKDEGERRRQQIENLVRENKSLDDNLLHLQSNKRALEGELDALTKKHEYTVSDMSSTVQRLENDNFSLHKTKEDLEQKLQNKNAEIRNVQYDLKHHREEVNKREILLHESISRNEAELHKDRELFKNLNNHHNALKKQLEVLTRERDENELHIRNLKDKELSLHNKLKSVTDELARSDGTNIKTELKTHVESRKRHLDEVKGILDLLSTNLTRIHKEEE